VLLFRLDASRDPDRRGYWYLPGGGIRPFERAEEAAGRELREETGIRDVRLGPVIGERRDVRFVFRGRRVVQDEWYVAGRLEATPATPVAEGDRPRRRDGERDQGDAARWWLPADLHATGETVFPPGLGTLVEAAVRAMPAPGPGR
jgi:ADP-ribose pyrophosphatase YjhB (NUDIX family)